MIKARLTVVVVDPVGVWWGLRWSADGKALIYGVERNGMTALIKQPLNGSPPEEIMSFDEDELFDFGYSYDGQSLAVTRGGWQHDVVLIRDFNRY